MARRRVRRPLLELPEGKKLKSPPEDPQAEEVYDWENRSMGCLFYWQRMTLERAKKLASRMAEYYGVKAPVLARVRRGPKNFTAIAFELDGKSLVHVNIDKAEFTAPLIAHEMAHVICDAFSVQEPDHGRTWLGVYLHLMDVFKIVPGDFMAASAREAGLSVRNPQRCTPEDM